MKSLPGVIDDVAFRAAEPCNHDICAAVGTAGTPKCPRPFS